MQNYPYGQINRYSPPKKRHLKRKVALILGVTALLMVGFHSFGGARLSRLFDDRSKVHASTIRALSLTPLQESQMSSDINSAINTDSEMDISVAIRDLSSGKSYNYGLTDPFIAASVSKLITASMYLSGAESGKYSLNTQLSYGSAGYELRQMIEQSDNAAWEDLNGILTHEGLWAYALRIGMSNYDPDQNTLTASDIAILLSRLYKGQLLNLADTQKLLSYMHSANETDYIIASVPAGVKAYHKAGWLSDRVHDAAIIDNGKHPYVLVIFTKQIDGDYDANSGQQAFASITQATIRAFIH